MSKKKFNIGEIEIGADQLFLISGPCVIEGEKIQTKIYFFFKNLYYSN